MSDSACCKELCNEKEDEFETPVETIMKCDEFKSNFARRLSNRYGVKNPATEKNDDEIQKVPTELNVPDLPEKSATPPETGDAQDACPKDDADSVLVGQKVAEINTSINKTEVIDLNRKVETLNWQLNQVETNRQIHTSLLKQIVIFLNRVKDHLENQELIKMDAELPVSTSGDLPRSCSVVHVNKNPEFTLMPVKTSASKKLSKSISNVNRFKEYSNWDTSKICVNIDTNSEKKIIEEMKRLIILATTLLNTKIPNLATQSANAANVTKKDIPKIEVTLLEPENKESESLAVPTDVARNINQNKDILDAQAGASCSQANNLLAPPHPFLFGIMTRMSSLDLLPIERKPQDDDSDRNLVLNNNDKPLNGDVNGYKHVNGLEDESGFSSLSSLQEIGIPIINIIPPTPPEELVFIEDDPMANGPGPHSAEAEPANVFWV